MLNEFLHVLQLLHVFSICTPPPTSLAMGKNMENMEKLETKGPEGATR